MSASEPSQLEAGPSKPAVRRPSTASLTPSERAQLDSSISARRRRHSVLDFWTGRRGDRKKEHQAAAERRGSVVSTVSGDEQVAQGDDLDEQQERLDEEVLRIPEPREAIKLMKDGQKIDFEDEDDDEAGNEWEGVPDEKQEYVWDVMFENQRGIYVFGKAYFSGQTLLPADPSPFTVPSKPLDGASSFHMSTPAQPRLKRIQKKNIFSHREPTSSPPKDRPKSSTKQRSIRTAYTLQTFQAPSPQWIWMTPWLINMRPGTDEAGWRYNAWFKKAGWKSHSGGLGWNGWVRRREWIRLRCLKPKEETLHSAAEKRSRVTSDDAPLADILTYSEEDKNVEAVLKALGHVALDRRKLDIWRTWLNGASKEARGKLQAILSNADLLHDLSHCFVQSSSLPAFRRLLEEHNLDIAHSSRFPSRSSSPPPAGPNSDETKPSSAPSNTTSTSPTPGSGG